MDFPFPFTKIFAYQIFFFRMTSQIESNEVIDRLVDADPTLSQFLNDDFQSEEYAMKIVTSEVVSDVLDSLNKKRFLIGQMLLYVKSIGQ